MAPHLHRRQTTTEPVTRTSVCPDNEPKHEAQGGEPRGMSEKPVEEGTVEGCEMNAEDHLDECVEVEAETEGFGDNLVDEGFGNWSCNTEMYQEEGYEGFARNETAEQGFDPHGYEADQEDHKDGDLDIAVDEEDIVEGWMLNHAQELPEPEQEADTVSGMQIAAKVRPTTVFASYLARMQAHFESMTAEQRANIIHLLYGVLETWRSEWAMSHLHFKGPCRQTVGAAGDIPRRAGVHHAQRP